MGGLGNQLFQYAAAKSLAHKNKCILYLDLSFLNDKSEKQDFTFREFELNNFNLSEPLFTFRHRFKFKFRYIFYNNFFVKYMISLFFNYKAVKPTYYLDHLPGFKADFFNNTSFTYLDGYFQSYLYFEEIKINIHEILSFKEEVKFSHLFDVNDDEFDRRNSVFVHVRRGDYASNIIINSVHGLCGFDYYEEAFGIISDKIKNPCFFVFTDDLFAAKQLFKNLLDKHKIFFQFRNSLIDEFRLMSACSNAIIANSSLSWWSAWLIKNESKVIISPKNWFKDSDLNSKTFKLIPDNWIKI